MTHRDQLTGDELAAYDIEELQGTLEDVAGNLEDAADTLEEIHHALHPNLHNKNVQEYRRVVANARKLLGL